MPDLVVGIDSSTTATKAIAWTGDGQMVAEGRADIPINSPKPDYFEQDPADWWASTRQALRNLCAKIDPTRIAAVSVSNQRETTGFFRRDGTVIRPGMVWLDERSRGLFRGLAESLGRDPDGSYAQHRISGKPIDIIPSATRIHWMKEVEPDLHAATEMFADVHGYITFRLTGEWRTSWSSADPLGLFDMQAKEWSGPILDAVGIEASRLPVAQRPGTVLARVTRAAAAETGLPEGTPVVAGGGDGQLAGLGCAALEADTAYLNIGTALVSGVHDDSYRISQAWRTMGGPTGEGYYYEACNRAGTFTVNWFLSNICAGETAPRSALLAKLEEDSRAIPIGSQGLLMLPYWQGIMTPYWDNAARGAFIGLSGGHSRAHLFRAMMEGLAMEQHLSLSEAERNLTTPITTIVAIGGGASSQVWRQIFADVMGKRVVRADTVEASSLGAAICAAMGAGWFDSFHDAARRMSGKILAVSEPDPAAHARYGELFAVYRQVYDRLLPLYPALGRFARDQ